MFKHTFLVNILWLRTNTKLIKGQANWVGDSCILFLRLAKVMKIVTTTNNK